MICLGVALHRAEAPFLGVVQVVVYTGAVMMLFLFVLMLVGVDSSDSLVETIAGSAGAAIVLGLGFGVLLDRRARPRGAADAPAGSTARTPDRATSQAPRRA